MSKPYIKPTIAVLQKEEVERIKMTERIYRIYRSYYTVPVNNPAEDTAENFYDYIDGLYGEFPPMHSELLLETDSQSEAERTLNQCGEQLSEVTLERSAMPEAVEIVQIDLRAEADSRFNSVEDRLTPVTILESSDMVDTEGTENER